MQPDPISTRLPEAVREYARLEHGADAEYARVALAAARARGGRRPDGASPRGGMGAIRRFAAALAARFARSEIAR